MEYIPVSVQENGILQALWQAKAPVTCADLSHTAGLDVSVSWHILKRLFDSGMVAAGGRRMDRVYQLTRAGVNYASRVTPVDAPGGGGGDLGRAIQSRAAASQDCEIARLVMAAVAHRGWPDRWPTRWRDIAFARMNNPDMTWPEVAATLGLTKDAAASAFTRFYAAAADNGYLTRRQVRVLR